MGKKNNKKQIHGGKNGSSSQSGQQTGHPIICDVPRETAGSTKISFWSRMLGNRSHSRDTERDWLEQQFKNIIATFKTQLTGTEDKVGKLENQINEILTHMACGADVNKKEAEETGRLHAIERKLQESQRAWDLEKAKLDEENRKLGADINDLMQEKPSVYLPNVRLAVFGIHRKDVDNGAAKKYFALLRVWCNFLEWSENGDASGFVRQFRKVDVELTALQDGEERETIRNRVAQEIANTVSKNLKATFEVRWDFKDCSYDESIHWSRTHRGVLVRVVTGALINRDGNVLEKADVECE